MGYALERPDAACLCGAGPWCWLGRRQGEEGMGPGPALVRWGPHAWYKGRSRSSARLVITGKLRTHLAASMELLHPGEIRWPHEPINVRIQAFMGHDLERFRSATCREERANWCKFYGRTAAHVTSMRMLGR